MKIGQRKNLWINNKELRDKNLKIQKLMEVVK